MVAGGQLLSACGSAVEQAIGPQLVPLFSPSFILAAGIEQRIPFGLIDQGIPLSNETGSFPVVVTKGGSTVLQTEVQGRVVAHDHPGGDADETHEHSDLQRYFAIRATLEEPGIYDLTLEVDERTAALTFQLFDPTEVVVPLPGEKLPDLRFPTFADEMDMDPICTQFGAPCPLHDRTIDEMLATGKPLALLIATPAFCETAYCGPVLDVMLELQPEFPGVQFLHAEVYQNPNQVGGNLLDENLRQSPTVVDLSLPFEPTLFLVRPDRTIVDRIDNVYDNTELREVLAKL